MSSLNLYGWLSSLAPPCVFLTFLNGFMEVVTTYCQTNRAGLL